MTMYLKQVIVCKHFYRDIILPKPGSVIPNYIFLVMTLVCLYNYLVGWNNHMNRQGYRSGKKIAVFGDCCMLLCIEEN